MTEYSAQDLTVLEGLEAVRKRPGMYIGTTGSKGYHHLLWEIVDNSMDEALNGNGKVINVTLYPDGSASVEDFGRGMPVDVNQKHKKTGVDMIFTILHAGAKFNNDEYSFSGGLHGVGASVVNALSTWLTVEVCRGGKKYREEFHSPEINGEIHSGVVKVPLHETGEKVKYTGTTVRFLPDKRVFGSESFDFDFIARKLKEKAYLNKGITLTLTDQRFVSDDEMQEYRKVEYTYDGGISDFVSALDEYKKKTVDGKPIYMEFKGADYVLEVAMEHTETYTESIFSYVNNIPTSEGGTHEIGFKSALTRCMNDLAREKKLLKEKDENLDGSDYRVGLTAVVCIKLKNVQFEGQTKNKLGNPEVRPLVDGLVYQALGDFLRANGKYFDGMWKKAQMAAAERLATKKAKDLARQKNNISAGIVVDKLAACSGKKPELNELFIVEGDSAGGSAKQGRDRATQAILSLRGKPLNAEKKSVEKILENAEIKLIIHALGAGFDDNFDLSKLKYDKIIILADADEDGGHIKTILLTFFYHYMRDLITAGHVYIGMPPLYKIEKGDYLRYAYNQTELDRYTAEAGKGYRVQRYKGLGEMNPEQLWDTTLDPKKRSIIRVAIEDAAEAQLMIETWMSDSVDIRKKYIMDNANFNKIDNFDTNAGE